MRRPLRRKPKQKSAVLKKFPKNGSVWISARPQFHCLVKPCRDVKTIIWNGPMGMFELAPFSKGTFQLGQQRWQIPEHSPSSAAAIPIRQLRKRGLSAKMSYISTGGGAFLEWLEGKTLPGIAALEKSQDEPQSKSCVSIIPLSFDVG